MDMPKIDFTVKDDDSAELMHVITKRIAEEKLNREKALRRENVAVHRLADLKLFALQSRFNELLIK